MQVQGALLSMGDAHAAQGDSELDGTAIETSITARVKLTLHKKNSLPKLVKVGPAASPAAAVVLSLPHCCCLWVL